MATKKRPLIVIVGESGVGKSRVAIEIASKFNGAIVCADSWSVYRGFDIGTAKPTKDEMLRIEHHLVDVAEPLNGFSAVEFQRLCKQAMSNIWANDKIPILVGGTGLYVDSVIYDYSFLPPSSHEERIKYEAMELSELKKLAEDMLIDTSAIDVQNKRRLIRLIENRGEMPKKHSLRPNTLIIGIKKDNKEDLDEAIAARVHAMIELGLVDEVKRLSDMYGWDIEPMKGIGYREFKDYFAGSKDISETIESIILNTKKLTKKQRTWFKRNNSIHWLVNSDKIVDLVTTFLNKY